MTHEEWQPQVGDVVRFNLGNLLDRLIPEGPQQHEPWFIHKILPSRVPHDPWLALHPVNGTGFWMAGKSWLRYDAFLTAARRAIEQHGTQEENQAGL